VILAVILVLVVVLSWFFVLSPLRGKISDTEQSIEAERDRLAAAQAKLAQAESTRLEGAKNRARLIALAKMVPTAAEVPSLIIQIQDLAEQAGLDFIAVSPREPSGAEGFQVVPLQVEFRGTFFDLNDFLYRVEHMVAGPGRLLAVKDLRLQLGGQSVAGEEAGLGEESPLLDISMTLYAFVTAAAKAPSSPATTTSTTAP